jgi:hypothetical protein
VIAVPDLLSHAFIAYTLCTLLAARYRWLTPQYVTVGMAGAFVPDIAKVDLVLPGAVVGKALGVPVSWFGVHTLGGAAVAALVGVVLAASGERRRVAALLALGAGSHLAADAGPLPQYGRLAGVRDRHRSAGGVAARPAVDGTRRRRLNRCSRRPGLRRPRRRDVGRLMTIYSNTLFDLSTTNRFFND